MEASEGTSFFGAFDTLRSAIPDHVQISHQSFARHSSIAATFGYRGSNAASESLTVNPFGIYCLMGGVDRSVSKVLVLGDFGSAASCLSVLRLVPGCRVLRVKV